MTRVHLGLGMALLLGGVPAYAVQFDFDNDDVAARWDNTVKYSAAWRVKDRSAALISDANQDDGDRNFGKGLISNRFDLLSEFDASYKRMFGVRLSAAGWYDDKYRGRTDHDSPSTGNNFSVPFNEFTDHTRRLHGKDAEILDAFVYTNGTVADRPYVLRLGRHSVLYGESLFFGGNGIAGAQSPVDIIKLLSVPNSQFKEIIRPVGQLSGQLQLKENLAIGGYYQFEWRRTLIPSAGSYFAGPDVLEGGQRFLLGAVDPGTGIGPALFHSNDLKGSDSGQGGIQVRWRPDGMDTEFGFYAVRYHDKTPQFYAIPSAAVIGGNLVVFDPANFDPTIGKLGQFRLAYAKNVTAYGLSFSTDVSGVNVAGEASVRRNTPLVSDPTIVGVTTAPGAVGDNDDNPLYAVGRSAHVQLSAIALFSPTAFWDGGSFIGEIAANRRLSVTKNPGALAANSTRDAWALRFIFEPLWNQVAPGLDLAVPVGVGYSAKGNSSVVSQFNPGGKKGGDLSIGVKALYQQVWKAGLSYSHYFGKEDPALNPAAQFSFRQYLKDRDFVAITVQRTF